MSGKILRWPSERGRSPIMSWPDSTRGPSAHGLDPWWAFSHELDPWAFSHGLDPWAPPPWGGGNKDGNTRTKSAQDELKLFLASPAKVIFAEKFSPDGPHKKPGLFACLILPSSARFLVSASVSPSSNRNPPRACGRSCSSNEATSTFFSFAIIGAPPPSAALIGEYDAIVVIYALRFEIVGRSCRGADLGHAGRRRWSFL
jgi:hypothetical protein